MIKFYDAIYKADRSKLVFIKTTDEGRKPFEIIALPDAGDDTCDEVPVLI
jgi:hypothetical protein